ncbi:MAG: archease [Nitrospirae bacterium]|nr:archease [Nitrospirota bacterium]
MKKYGPIDISGDAGLRIWGEGLPELFANAAEGMFNLITDVSNVTGPEEREIAVSAESIEDLLIKWLNELVFLFDTYGLVGKEFSIDLLPPHPPLGKGGQEGVKLKAKISGGIFNPQVNESRLLIKAATYHSLSVRKNNSKWEAVVIFDI